MMIFQHTIDKVLSGEKTATRRLIKPNEYSIGLTLPMVCYHAEGHGNDRVKWHVGQSIAVQPGRGKSAVARIRIESIERDDDVRDITAEEAKAEGFDGPSRFLEAWTKMHDPSAAFWFDYDIADYHWYVNRKVKWTVGGIEQLTAFLATRPAERYAAWAIKFALVDEKEPA
jgi:hypothetical protein